MRIVQVTQSYPPMVSGAANVVQRLAEEMAARGHEVVVLAASDRGRAYVQEEAGVRVVRLKSRKNRMRVDQTFVLGARRRILDEFRQFQPQVVHTHEPLFMGVPALLYSNRADIPVIYTAHTLPRGVIEHVYGLRLLRKWANGVIWAYLRWYTQRCSLVIAPSRPTAETLAARVDCPTAVLSSAVDSQVFKPDGAGAGERGALFQRFGLRPDLPVILHVGRLDADKGVEVVVSAAARVMEAMPAQALVVGDGTQRSELIQQAAASGFGERFIFPGFVTEEALLAGLYRNAAVFTTASEIETQGIVLLEAAASGLPIVAADAAAVDEIVLDGENGYLVPPKDPERMADCIVELLRNSELAQAMGQASRRIVARHSIENVITKYEVLCARLAESAGG